MYETAEDLAALSRLLDESYASAGPHLLSIHTPDRRLSAERLAEMLTGVRILALATATAKGEPLVGPVDGLSTGAGSGSAPARTRSDSGTSAPGRR